MLAHIPTHLIAGPLGAGKTTLLRHLLEHRPEAERWAVLINEFGAVGIDAALVGSTDGVQIAEIPGGCLCCVNGLPFQVGLGRLLRRARPDRLFIEASGLGHPAALLEQLQAPPWAGVLQLESMLMVLDALALASARPLPASQAEALRLADLLVLNKSASLDEAQRRDLLAQLPPVPASWCERGQTGWPLPVRRPSEADKPVDPPSLPTKDGPAGRLMLSTKHWECLTQTQGDWHSVGWVTHPARRFDQRAVAAWIALLPYARAKGLLHTTQGWRQFNALATEPLVYTEAPAGRSSRLELLFQAPVDIDSLDKGLRACSRDA